MQEKEFVVSIKILQAQIEKIQQALCKGAGGEKVDHPISAQSSRDDCYSF